MPTTAPQTMLDPLHAFAAGAFLRGSRLPVPLLSTHFEVSLDAGLATVVTRRVFRNAEAESIEATITFPVPVQAALFELTARIDGRLLRARAQTRAGARAAYENAIERGKAAVLHEEVLRGVHMLSVAHIAPGSEIEVTASWAMPLDGRGRLRIPLTVGDIYGRSPLPDSDALVHGGPGGSAELAVRCTSGTVALAGGALDGGRATVPLNAPIDLLVSGWTPRELGGRAADGREVGLRIEPEGEGEAPLALAMLIDRSGSMQEPCSGDGPGISKHRAVANGLVQAARLLRAADAVDVWQFDNDLEAVGATTGLPGNRSAATPADRLRELAARLGAPRGGTEIGAALTGVIGRSEAHDIVLVTDGKSHALDVQALARSGRRFSVVLVGEDSLEANVGHLAAATGGEIVVVGGDEVGDALAACLAALRHPGEVPAPISGEPKRLELRRNGLRICAEWRRLAQPVEDGRLARAVAAVAAGLAIPAMEPEAATALATAEGLVTHLTSLVLVDEEGAVHEGQPASRAVALPTPRTAFAMPLRGALYDPPSEESMPCAAPMPAAPASSPAQTPARRRSGAGHVGAPTRPATAPTAPAAPAASRPRQSGAGLARIRGEIAWTLAPNRLRAGDLGGLQPHVASGIRAAAADPEVVALAAKLGLEPVVLVLALLARASSDRSAARFAKSVLGERPSPQIRALAGHLGLGKSASILGWLRSRGEDERPLQ